MNGYNFTERLRRVLAMAREESARLQHEYVGTEHLLLALIREGQSVATSVLQQLGVDLRKIARSIEDIQREGSGRAPTDLPYTSRAKKVLELAMEEARDLAHSYVGCEHLLLGLIREEKGIAAQALAQGGATLAAVRAETLRVLGPDAPSSESPSLGHRGTAPASVASTANALSIGIALRKGNVVLIERQFNNYRDAIRFLVMHDTAP